MHISRRGFLAGLGAGAFVVGFDPGGKRWVKAAEASCTTWPGFDPVPPLDGTLHTDLPTRTGDSRDQGNIIHQLPAAVLRPGSVEDIAKMVRFCRKHGIQVAARGQHHTVFGQGLTCGLIIDMTSLAQIHSIDATSAVVDAGVSWHALYQAAFVQGLRPVTTGYTNLSVGGTLSVGGCPLSNDKGGLVDHARELVIVTGKGDTITCSETSRPDLFEAALGGLGQCGIIARVKVDLLPALPRARTYLLHYSDPAAFFRDMWVLINRGEFDEIYMVCVPPGSTFTYEINATKFYHPSAPPNDLHLLRGTTVPPVIQDQAYLDYAFYVDTQISLMQLTGWDDLVKPWFDVWLPGTAVEAYVTEAVSNLSVDDVGPGGFVLVFPQWREKLTRPFFRVPDSPDWVFLFDILTTSQRPGRDDAFAQRMLARNRTLYDKARAVGGTRYPIGALDFTHDDWVDHYGPQWNAFATRKHRFDPDNILTPGPAIF